MDSAEHLDVAVIGAGISGIDLAYRLQTMCPGRTYAVLEARDRLGGTWDLFRYPGIRSDSDMYTLGFPFAPWTDERSIADGGAIRDYLEATAARFGITEKVRFGTRVTAAAWDSAAARWTLSLVTPDGPRTLTASWLHLATGYYDYAGGYAPHFPGQEGYAGRLVHPQAWPEDLDVAGRRIVVIGSGATAVTLVPALVERGAQVTMLQRSPTWVVSLAGVDPIAGRLTARFGADRAARLVRLKNATTSGAFYQLTRRSPATSRRLLQRLNRSALAAAGVEPRHFTPSYDPWDQRLCVVPDGDLFGALASGNATVVTDTVAGFEHDGVRTGSGELLPADIVVTATGLQLLVGGGIDVTVDGQGVDIPGRHVYRGVLLERVPNLSLAMGYINASWTLRVDLVSQYVCRLLNLLAERGDDIAYATPDTPLTPRPLLPLRAGYVERAAGALPTQGNRAPWTVIQSYLAERAAFGRADLTDEMVFERAHEPAARG